MGAYDAMKVAAMLSFQRKAGCNEQEAALAAMALHPLENSRRPISRQLEKDLRKASRRFAKASRQVTSSTELGEITDVALSRYAVMARVSGDEYYKDLFTDAWLKAMVDMSDERRAELEEKL